MARTHGKVLAEIWRNPDFTGMTIHAQWLYMLLLSQPKLSLAGCIDRMPARWARLAPGATAADIEAWLDELASAEFVVIDHDTDEVLIRSFTRHDVSTTNRNLRKGVWSAWAAIQSEHLRHVAAHNMPAQLVGDEAPGALRQLRNTPLGTTDTTGVRTAVRTGVGTNDYDYDNDDDDDTAAHARSNAHPQPGTTRLPPNERQQRIHQAVDLLVERHLARNPSTGNPKRHASAVRNGKLRDHHEHAHQLLVDHPDLTPQRLAELLEPTTHTGPPTRPDPHSNAQAAARALAERNARRARGDHECPTCTDTGLVELDDGTCALCPDCRSVHA